MNSSNKDILVLNRNHPLFTDQKIQETKAGREITREVSLYIPDPELSIPFTIKAATEPAYRLTSILPYGTGYVFNGRDLTSQGRLERILEAPDDHFRREVITEAPLRLNISNDEWALHEAGINGIYPVYFDYGKPLEFPQFHPHLSSLMNRLRVQVAFPDEIAQSPKENEDFKSHREMSLGEDPLKPEKSIRFKKVQTYLSRTDEVTIDSSYHSFEFFYPAALGPLPWGHSHEMEEALEKRFGKDPPEQIDLYNITIWEGLGIQLPANENLLKRPSIRFFLAEPNENELIGFDNRF